MEVLETRGIRPQTPYDLRSPWGDNRIPSTKALAGQEFVLTSDDGGTFTMTLSEDELAWQGPQDAAGVTASYDAVESRPGIYFIDFAHDDPDRITSVVLNLGTGGAIVIRHTIVRGTARADLRQELYPCVIGSDGTAPALTTELVGKRAYAEYADGHAVEHVYFNPRRIVWQGLGRFEYSGSECDVSTLWKVDEQLYLLTWVEEWQAVGAALLLDYQAMRTVGVLYGLDDTGHVHTLCGARLKLLSEMDYPPGYEPGGVARTN